MFRAEKLPETCRALIIMKSIVESSSRWLYKIHTKISVGYVQLHAANKSQVKGEIKAITNDTAKKGRK
jgi:hypothetical protein